jgi:hypothetical protein
VQILVSEPVHAEREVPLGGRWRGGDLQARRF